MMIFFQPPICRSKRKEDQKKFNLIWHIGLVTLTFSTFMTVLHINENTANLFLSVFGVLFSIMALVILFKSGKHELIAVVIVIVGTIFIQYSIYSLLNPDRTIDLLWIFVYTLFSFYTLNKIYGYLTYFVNIIGFFLYQLILTHDMPLNHDVFNLQFPEQMDYYINIVFCSIAIVFFIFRLTQKPSNE